MLSGAVRLIVTAFGPRGRPAKHRQKLSLARLNKPARLLLHLTGLALGTALFAPAAWTVEFGDGADHFRLQRTGSVIAQATESHELSATAQAAACARTMERFIPELDAVMIANPRSLMDYFAVLAKYLHLKNGVRGLPTPAPDTSITGCNFEQVTAIAKRSRFFHQATATSTHSPYSGVELRSSAVIVGFAVENATGNIAFPWAKWTTVYP